MKLTKRVFKLICVVPIICLLWGCDKDTLTAHIPFIQTSETETAAEITSFDMKYVPEYSGVPYCEINNSHPFFTDEDMTVHSYEYYSPLDDLGRCGECIACIGKDIMPTEKRESIGMVKPSGWQLVRYDGIVNGNYLFNRCHLIGFQLTGENANECNLITGTRYLNEDGMLPFENMAASYVRKTNNHVLYRVTPIFEGDDLLATGVLMEAKSVEDNGEGLQFNVFCYNVQPHIYIDYSTGENHLIDADLITTKKKAEATKKTATTAETTETVSERSEKCDYVINISSGKFHLPDCPSVADMKEKNKQEFVGSREKLISDGYIPCKQCSP